MGAHRRCSDFQRVKKSVKTLPPVPRDARYPTRLRERQGYAAPVQLVTPGNLRPTGVPVGDQASEMAVRRRGAFSTPNP